MRREIGKEGGEREERGERERRMGEERETRKLSVYMCHYQK